MALNFQQLGMLAKLKSAFSTFQQEHPKFMPFIHAGKRRCMPQRQHHRNLRQISGRTELYH